MLAIPMDNYNATTLSQLFGNAPYFALLDLKTGMFRVVENEMCGNGGKSANYIFEKGANKTIFYYMGEGVYNELDKNGIEVFSSNKQQLTLDEIYMHFLNDKCMKLDESNYKTLLDSGSKSCTCGQ